MCIRDSDYPLGKELLERYGVLEQIPIENHNNIPVMREKENKEFPRMKRSLIIGVRKTHKYVPNEKVSDFLVQMCIRDRCGSRDKNPLYPAFFSSAKI